MKRLIITTFFIVAAAASGHMNAQTPKVLVIGIDGMRADAMEVASTPNIDALIANGTYSRNSTASDQTFSGPGWTDFLHGVHRDQHLVNTNGTSDNPIEPDPQFQIFSGSNQHLYPDVLAIANVAMPALKTARFTGEWNPIHTTRSPAGSEYTFVGNDAQATADAVSFYTNNDADIGFIYFANPDFAGHGNGFNPNVTAYTNQISATDAQIGSVIAAIQNRPTYGSEDWLFVLTSDHGGDLGGGHGGNQPWQREVPFIASGDSVVNQLLPYGTKNVDVVPTALAHLGISAPSHLVGHAVGFSPPPLPPIVLDANLIFHGDAEYDRGFTNRSLDQAITGWNEFPGVDMISETTPYNGFDSATILQNSAVGPAVSSGDNLFSGGGNVNATMVQEIDVSSLGASIDGGLNFQLAALLGGEGNRDDRADFRVRFLDVGDNELGQLDMPGPDAAERGNLTTLYLKSLGGVVPVGTRTVEVALLTFGTTALADNLSFLVTNDVIPIAGDMDADGDIDGADWLIYVDGLGSSMPGITDLTGDGLNNYADFLLFQQLYLTANGAGSFESMLANIPEPSALALAVFAALLVRRRAW